MAWDDVARQDHRRVCARYPSDMTDREWAIIAPLLSGSRAPLPEPSPLRTGRDDCSSSGSSLGRLAPDPRVVPMMAPPVCQPHPGLGCLAHHTVDTGRVPARVLLGDPADRKPFCGCGADQELLQVLHPLSVPGRRGTVDPILQSLHDGFGRGPVDLGPRRLPSPAGLFGLHRLTSPAIKRHTSSQPSRPWRKSAPFRAGYTPLVRCGPYPPHYRAAFACSAVPLPPPPCPSLRSGYHRVATVGRMGLTLLSNVERRMGRLRPIVRRVFGPPSSVVAADEPTRVPFWLRPVSTFGRLRITDLNHGRSRAFSLPSSAGPLPDWCFQIEAVVPEASHVGLLLGMSG